MSHIWQRLKETMGEFADHLATDTEARKNNGADSIVLIGGMEMECKCPPGYPKRIQHDFGSGATAQALKWSIPVPGFEVEAHTGECFLTDEVKVPLLSLEGAKPS